MKKVFINVTLLLTMLTLTACQYDHTTVSVEDNNAAWNHTNGLGPFQPQPTLEVSQVYKAKDNKPEFSHETKDK